MLIVPERDEPGDVFSDISPLPLLTDGFLSLNSLVLLSEIEFTEDPGKAFTILLESSSLAVLLIELVRDIDFLPKSRAILLFKSIDLEPEGTNFVSVALTISVFC